jgi:hypothetical protein
VAVTPPTGKELELAEDILRDVFGQLPAACVRVERDVVGSAGREQIAYTVEPTRSDAASLFVLLIATEATLMTGSGDHRNRFEYPRYESASSALPFELEFRSTLEAVVAGRIKDTIVASRTGRVLRVVTEITLMGGKVLRATSTKGFAFRKIWQSTQYGPYAGLEGET